MSIAVTRRQTPPATLSVNESSSCCCGRVFTWLQDNPLAPLSILFGLATLAVGATYLYTDFPFHTLLTIGSGAVGAISLIMLPILFCNCSKRPSRRIEPETASPPPSAATGSKVRHRLRNPEQKESKHSGSAELFV